jgi:hypothetical protein
MTDEEFNEEFPVGKAFWVIRDGRAQVHADEVPFSTIACRS